MKLFSIFILSLLTLSNCGSKSQSLEELSINYNAATRGSFISLIANSSEINYSDMNGDKKITLSKKQSKEIKELVSKIDINTIESLKAPSEGSHVDRALIASLTITIDGISYVSSTFDHGNPPEELKRLIDSLLKIVY